MTTSDDALAVIDHWEGYEAALEDKAPYMRRRTRLIETDLDAWGYVWNRPLDGLVAIPSGDWRSHFEANPPAWAR